MYMPCYMPPPLTPFVRSTGICPLPSFHSSFPHAIRPIHRTHRVPDREVVRAGGGAEGEGAAGKRGGAHQPVQHDVAAKVREAAQLQVVPHSAGHPLLRQVEGISPTTPHRPQEAGRPRRLAAQRGASCPVDHPCRGPLLFSSEHVDNMTSFYGSSCANNGKGALNTPEG
eukprot:1192094-Prorocentrum_minimum.AAC.5